MVIIVTSERRFLRVMVVILFHYKKNKNIGHFMDN